MNKLEFDLENKFYFSCMQLIDSLSVFWKKNIMDDKGKSINPCIFDFHFKIYVIKRLNSKGLYFLKMSLREYNFTIKNYISAKLLW